MSFIRCPYGALVKPIPVICPLRALIPCSPVACSQAQAQDRDHETRLLPVISSDKLKVSAPNTAAFSLARIEKMHSFINNFIILTSPLGRGCLLCQCPDPRLLPHAHLGWSGT